MSGAYEQDDWLTVSKLVELGLAEPGMKLRFDGESGIVEVASVDREEFSIVDSGGRIREWDEVAYHIIDPLPNVE